MVKEKKMERRLSDLATSPRSDLNNSLLTTTKFDLTYDMSLDQIVEEPEMEFDHKGELTNFRKRAVLH